MRFGKLFISKLVLIGIFTLVLFSVANSPVKAADICPGRCTTNCDVLKGYAPIPASNCASGNVCCVTVTPTPFVKTCQNQGGVCRGSGCMVDIEVEDSTYNGDCDTGLGEVCCMATVGTETEFNCDQAKNPLLIPKCALEEAGTLTSYVLEMVIVFGAVLALIFIIIGAFMIMTAQDDAGKMEKGRLTITWAIAGLTIAASAFVIMKLFSSLFNVPAFGYLETRVYAQEELPSATIQISGTLKDAETSKAIKDAEVYLYVDESGKWTKWSGKDYSNQRNPQKLDVTGEYLFIVPPGKYYIRARSTGYYDVKSKPFNTGDKPIRVNLTMEKASELWQLVLASGVVLFIGGVAFIGIRTFMLWNKKRRVKMMVLKKVKEAGEAQKKDLYPQDKVKK